MTRAIPIIAALMAAGPASAADFGNPGAWPVETHSWNGLYIGGHLGAALAGDAGGLDFDFDNDGDFGDGIAAGIEERDDAGFVYGAHAGADLQFGHVVIGAVADISSLGADIRSSATGDSTLGISRHVDFVATGRVRAGLAAGRALLYGTGGFAVADIESDYILNDPFGLVSSIRTEKDDNSLGYAVGGGIDYAVLDQLSLGAQYLYANFGDSDFTAVFNRTAGPIAIRTGDELDFHMLQAKLSYRFF